ncbi:hypothetical protein RUND412_004832 [Rhizina undulata]
MRYRNTLLSLPVLLTPSLAAAGAISRRFLNSVNPLNSVLLFDAPAYQSAENSSTWTATFRAFAYLNQIDLSPLTSALTSALEAVGVEVGDKLNVLEERTKLFGAVASGGKKIDLNINGCSAEVKLVKTAGIPDLGMLEKSVELGTCGGDAFKAKVDLMSLDSRDFEAAVFPSAPDGFGIISDIDDTIKISHVLDKVLALKTIFLEDTKPTETFPELYSALEKSLDGPQFIYLSGSPFQLYPMLKQFVAKNYPAGPILLQNLTLVDIPGLIEFVQGATQEYKNEGIDRIHSWYPEKKWFAIGDSTQKDPEVYGDAFRKYGADWIKCIWIREVDGGNNTDARFAEAFGEVPADRWRVIKNATEVMHVDVKGGSC